MTPALKILRVKMGLTIQDVSDRMGIAVSNVWRIEEGKNIDAAAILAYVRAISL
jgi:transcriptional regulator with XRE-family HTH domain